MPHTDTIKILMTADTVGGVWTYCMELCRALQPHGADVHLVTMGARMSAAQKREAGALENVTVYETEYRLEWMQQPWEDVERCGRFLLQLEEELQPDVVHLNCFAYGSLPFRAPVLVVAHSDVFSWFDAVKGTTPSAGWSNYFECVKAGLAGADLLVAPSKCMMEYVRDIYSVDTPGRVIYNGRNAAHFRPSEKQARVFSMGRLWDEAKNVRLLMDAAPLVNATIAIAGDNSFDQKELAVSQNVTFLGKLPAEEIAEQLSTASVFVLPAKYEPFGLSALEAALSGCALVLGDIPSLREIWQEAAVYVDANDAKALASTVNRLLENAALLAQYCSRARERAQAFSSEAMAESYRHLYGQLIQQIQTKQAYV